MSAIAGGRVKTLAKFLVRKNDLIERLTNDDRHLGNGFGTLNIAEYCTSSEFSHSLATLATLQLAPTMRAVIDLNTTTASRWRNWYEPPLVLRPPLVAYIQVASGCMRREVIAASLKWSWDSSRSLRARGTIRMQFLDFHGNFAAVMLALF
jgi:hypothetical protein